MHAEIRIGDSIIMAAEPYEDSEFFPASIYVYVKDSDATYKDAISYGCEPVLKPTTVAQAKQRYCGVKDTNGNIWWIATHLEDLS